MMNLACKHVAKSEKNGFTVFSFPKIVEPDLSPMTEWSHKKSLWKYL